MNVLVLYNAASEDAAIDERDVLVQRDAVTAALRRLGHETGRLACTLDLGAAQSRLRELRPDAVFNLVEALGGTDRLAAAATLLLDAMELPYTGSSTEALLATNNKITAKRRLHAAGLPTPAWFEDRWHGLEIIQRDTPNTNLGRKAEDPQAPASGYDRRAIVKAIWEHASFGIDDTAIVEVASDTAMRDLLASREAATGKPYFAEAFIEGREFNLTVLAGPDGPVAAPPAEIDFGAFPEGKPHIVGYAAKWDEASFEYHHTPRRFEFPPEDRPLLKQLTRLARDCWFEFGLRGYARVDFRVDRAGRPYILEVNANPCLAPDAGFAAAVHQAGIGYDQAIANIVADALTTNRPDRHARQKYNHG